MQPGVTEIEQLGSQINIITILRDFIDLIQSHSFASLTVMRPYRTFAGRRQSRGPIVEAKEWIAVTGRLEFVNDWEKTPSGGVFSLDGQAHIKPYGLKNPRSSRTTAAGWSSGT